jgi:hypothetical protein
MRNFAGFLLGSGRVKFGLSSSIRAKFGLCMEARGNNDKRGDCVFNKMKQLADEKNGRERGERIYNDATSPISNR